MQLPSFFNDFTLPPLEWHQQMREWGATMRATEPVWFDEQNNNWRIFRYADHIRVQNDYATFSSAPAPGEDAGAENSIIAMDPPRHRQLRSLVTQAFSARTIAQLAPRIEEITRELLQPALDQGRLDVVGQLAVPLPIIVIADMLGFPHENWPLIKQWTDSLLSDSSLGEDEASTDAELPLTQAQVITLYEQMPYTMEERRQHPRQDILSLLLAAEVDGEHLSEDDLYAFFITLLVAGNITTTQLIGNAFLCFDQHPDVWEQLRQDPSLLPGAIEEILRCLPPNRGTGGPRTVIGGRAATTDVQLGDRLIRKGQIVKVTTIAANFDDEQFPDPFRFDIRRNPNRHLSFGHGIHFCLGAPLARLEARIVLENMLRLLPSWQRDKEVSLRQFRSNIVFGVKNLPIVF